jgi:hypothetical protein
MHGYPTTKIRPDYSSKKYLSASMLQGQIFSLLKRGLKKLMNRKSVFISPDSSREERAKRIRKLVAVVAQLKQKIQGEPGMYHYIQNGKLRSAEKETTTAC